MTRITPDVIDRSVVLHRFMLSMNERLRRIYRWGEQDRGLFWDEVWRRLAESPDTATEIIAQAVVKELGGKKPREKFHQTGD